MYIYINKIKLHKIRVNYRILLEKKLKEAPDVESKILKRVCGVTDYNKHKVILLGGEQYLCK
jgi:hypothetical protein